MTNQDEDARPTYKEILECIEENKDNGLRTYIEHRVYIYINNIYILII